MYINVIYTKMSLSQSHINTAQIRNITLKTLIAFGR